MSKKIMWHWVWIKKRFLENFLIYPGTENPTNSYFHYRNHWIVRMRIIHLIFHLLPYVPLAHFTSLDGGNSTRRKKIMLLGNGSMKLFVAFSLKSDRSFYESRSFLSTDQGNHYGSTTGCPRYTLTSPPCHHISKLILFHFHVKSYTHFILKFFSRAHGYGFTNSSDCNQVPAGKHYCLRIKELIRSEPEKRYPLYYHASCQVKIPLVKYGEFYDSFCGESK